MNGSSKEDSANIYRYFYVHSKQSANSRDLARLQAVKHLVTSHLGVASLTDSAIAELCKCGNSFSAGSVHFEPFAVVSNPSSGSDI
jgi:hypothetical protein